MPRIENKMIKAIRQMIEDGVSTSNIVEVLGCTAQNVYTQRSALRKIAEREDSQGEEIEGSELLESSDPDFWKVRYLEAHALLVEHGIV